MWFMDITVAKPGTDVEAVENLLLETFERFEKTEVFVTEKKLQVRVGSSHTAYRYRVYTKADIVTFSYLIGQLRGRLEARAKSEIRMTHPQSISVFPVDRPRNSD